MYTSLGFGANTEPRCEDFRKPSACEDLSQSQQQAAQHGGARRHGKDVRKGVGKVFAKVFVKGFVKVFVRNGNRWRILKYMYTYMHIYIYIYIYIRIS